MTYCPHITLHTERFINNIIPPEGVPIQMGYVIVTYCADCGKELKRVKIIPKP